MGKNYKSIAEDTLKLIEQGFYTGCFKRIVFAVKTNNESMIESFSKRFLI